ncbi:MAG: PAS-domain containing protein, partial [Alphaproteobacteria bacterium]|nr:PAS-domain containing protein [Alphaproteobacteria bacterium]
MGGLAIPLLAAAPIRVAGAAALGPASGSSVSVLAEIHASWLIVAGALVALGLFVPVVLWFRRRLGEEVAARTALAQERARLDEILNIAPDGFYYWRYGPGGKKQSEVCSRRLAVLLGLYEGTSANFEAVLDSLDSPSRALLREATAKLRNDGTAFEIDLTQEDGERHVLAIGIRSSADDGTLLADVVWMRDVTDSAAAVTASRYEAAETGADRDRLRSLLDTLPVPVWVRDNTLSLTYCNRAYAAAVDAASPEVAMAEGRELAQGAAVRQTRALASLARAAAAARTEMTHLVIGGERRLIAVTEAPLMSSLGPDGESRYTAGVALDMTRIEEVEDELSRHLAAQANVLEMLATAIAIFGADTHLTYYNTAFMRLWRLDEGWLAERPSYFDFLEMAREQRRLPEVADYPAFKRQELGRFTSLITPLEDLLHLPDGATLRRVVSPHPLGGLQCTYEDVTDRLALERSYNTLIAVQRETLDHLVEAVAVFGADGRLRLFNPAYAKLWNHSPEELAGEPRLSDLLETYQPFFADVLDWPAFKAEMQGLLTDRTPRDGRISRSDGTILYYASFPLPDGGELLTYEDVSGSVQVERALMERNDALRAANRLRSQFVSSVSYEVGAPLSTLVELVGELADEEDGPLIPAHRDRVAAIAETAHNLAAVIDDIIDLASIEAGELSLEIDAFDVQHMLTGVLALTRERVRRQGIELTVDCPPDVTWMVADERRIKQVLFTLLSNAIKFTEKGGRVTLSVRRQDDEIAFTVADTGIGISEVEQDALFRGAASGRPPEGGAIGLSLVKSFIDLHGGRVEFESVAGEGTVITCRVPSGSGTKN